MIPDPIVPGDKGRKSFLGRHKNQLYSQQKELRSRAQLLSF